MGAALKLAEVMAPGRDFSLDVVQNLVGLCWKQVPTMTGVRQLERAFRETLEVYPSIGFLTILEDPPARAGAPANVRSSVANLLQHHGDRIDAALIIYDGGGIRSAIVRSVITGINLLSGARFPNQVFGDPRLGMKWLVEQLGSPKLTESDVLALIARLRN